MAISRFLATNRLTHRVATHKAQRAPGEVRAEALAHLEVQVPRANDPSRHQDFVMNMDQTPIYHSMEGDKTIDAVGAKTVNLRSAANDGQRVTVAVIVTASGRRVESMIVFKGELYFSCKMRTEVLTIFSACIVRPIIYSKKRGADRMSRTPHLPGGSNL